MAMESDLRLIGYRLALFSARLLRQNPSTRLGKQQRYETRDQK